MVFVSDLGEKEALLNSNSDAFFTTPHYDGYAVVLVDLDKIDHDELRELITDSWLIKAPPKLRRQFASADLEQTADLQKQLLEIRDAVAELA